MDRQDIDALLIGALYGELTPADEARLSAHLESHPTDRGALDDLKVARQAVRESRIFELQLDPPQHVSALLLQEAHRRAPKRVVVTEEQKEGWFYRFTRAFMAHPAMAAAAMLVLVGGVASMLYVKKGKDYAQPSLSDEVAERLNAAPVTGATSKEAEAPAEVVAAQGSAAPAEIASPDPATTTGIETTKDGFVAGLADSADVRRDAAEKNKVASASERWRQEKKAERPATKKAPSRGIAVATEQQQPKDFDSSLVAGDEGGGGSPGGYKGAAGVSGNFAGPAGGAGTAGTVRNAPPAQAAPASDKLALDATGSTSPAPQKPTAPTAAPKADARVTAQAPKPAEPAPPPPPAPEAKKAADSALLAWAKQEHARAIALVKKQDCSAAARVAVTVSNRAADYYAQFMASDRQLKSCMAYINNARDAEAEKSSKSRAQKRVNADEAPAPAPSQAK